MKLCSSVSQQYLILGLSSSSACTDRPTPTYQVLREHTEWSPRLNSDGDAAFFSCRQDSPTVIYDLQNGHSVTASISSVEYPHYSPVKTEKDWLTLIPTTAAELRCNISTYLHIIRGNSFSQRARFNFHSFHIGTYCYLHNRGFLKNLCNIF